jgi:hypothetical protein
MLQDRNLPAIAPVGDAEAGTTHAVCMRACWPVPPKEVDFPMLTRIRRRLPLRGNGPWIVIATAAAAMIITPFALAAGEGRPIDGGRRNPSANQSLAYNQETEIIANVSTFGTRQSNKSTSGGGAIYGCRARAGTRSCVRASNLSNGRAFSFASNSGNEVGRIDGPAAAAPFTTSATGVATGLNADRVDGQSASEIVTAAQADNKFAIVSAAGALGAQRGATAAARTAPGVYTVTFSGDNTNCAPEATVRATGTPAFISANVTSATTVAVTTFSAAAPPAPADVPFSLTLTC